MAPINLQKFCGNDKYSERRGLHRPFSAEWFTWASNGHIAVRIPALPEYGPQKRPLEMASISKKIDSVDGVFMPMSRFELPEFTEKITNIGCADCDGRGTEHDCPDCACACDECNGTGLIEKKIECSAGLLGGIFNIKYLQMIAELPDVEILVHPSGNYASFRFKGGSGLLMGMRRASEIHHDLLPRSEAPE